MLPPKVLQKVCTEVLQGTELLLTRSSCSLGSHRMRGEALSWTGDGFRNGRCLHGGGKTGLPSLKDWLDHTF